MRSLTIELPHLPWPELTANSRRREHWTTQYRTTQIAKDEVGWLAKIEWNKQSGELASKPMDKAKISYEFHCKDKRIHDYDGWITACKPIPDALIEVGVLVYDDAAHLEIGSIKMVPDTEDQTIITLEEV